MSIKIQARPQLLAGSGEKGNKDGPSIKATFSGPTGVCMDDRKNIIVADQCNNCIRQISLEGKVSTIAGGVWGYKDGNGKDASFTYPFRVCMDRKQNIIVAATLNDRIRRISESGDVETIAGSGKAEYQDGYKLAASFNWLRGVCVDKLNNIIVADSRNHRIRKISPLGQVTTVAGSGKGEYQDGEGILASFNLPYGVCIDNYDIIIVADNGNHLIRKINLEGIVTTLAGSGEEGNRDGIASNAHFSKPIDVCIDNNNNIIVLDEGRVSVIVSGYVTTIKGCFQPPGYDNGICVDDANNIILANRNENKIMKIELREVIVIECSQ